MSDDVQQARVNMALGALEGLVRCGEDLAGKVSAPTDLRSGAPVDEGTLRASVTMVIIVNGARFEGEGAHQAAKSAVRAAVRAGRCKLDVEVSANTVYSARQHEELDWKHPKGGQAKYLERPLVENASRYENIISLSAATAVERV